jgi:hypothetical protein
LWRREDIYSHTRRSNSISLPNPAATDKSSKASASALAALQDFAARVGFKEDQTKKRSSIFNGVTLTSKGEIVKINWSKKALDGTLNFTLSKCDFNMPLLGSLNLCRNPKLEGTVEGGVK